MVILFGHSIKIWVLSLSKNCITYLMSGFQLKDMLWAFNRWGSALYTLTKTSPLTWCLDANSELFSLATQPRLWYLYCRYFLVLYVHLFKILMLVSYLIEYFHPAIKFPVHFFRKPFRLLLCLFLKVAINIYFQFLSLVILFVPYVLSISL